MSKTELESRIDDLAARANHKVQVAEDAERAVRAAALRMNDKLEDARDRRDSNASY